MIDFKPITTETKDICTQFLSDNISRGCETSFANLNMWGFQQYAIIYDQLIIFSFYNKHYFYSYPIGNGDKKLAIDAIIKDAKERNIDFNLTWLYGNAKDELSRLYPDSFMIKSDRASFDYIYDINDLADLPGRKYHKKRTHVNKFLKSFPNYKIVPVTSENITVIKPMLEKWYHDRLVENPDNDYDSEQKALEKALIYFDELNMDGIILIEGDETENIDSRIGKSHILAFTFGSPLSHDTFDVNFEKARWDIDGAYTVICSEFARYIRDKYPHIKFLNREDDMGLEGLRRSKESYYPHHMLEKCRALLIPTNLSFCSPSKSTDPALNHDFISALRGLWKEAFDDDDNFLDTFFSKAYDETRCRIAVINGNVAAALYWFNCTLNEKPVAYIYAVATTKKLRGRGICHALMENTHAHLKTLGYTYVILSPASEALGKFYESLNYKPCSYINEFWCECLDKKDYIDFIQSSDKFIKKIDKHEYATLRRKFLPPNSIIQENENLDFLETYATFYTGNDFILTVSNEHPDGQPDTLNCLELLGNAYNSNAILNALGFKKGCFRCPLGNTPMAMYLELDCENESNNLDLKDTLKDVKDNIVEYSPTDIYIGFLFD